MAILNMNYSVSGSGGGNIGEPLNLTVTSVGLDATITWEDNEIGTIPPTTFQKSELVRKIGSAPTSPSDGDLVITETVKDTYKTTGYVDQGLTDGETYYYRVFSYSDLGGISYCDAVSITPSGGWQPGVNTVLYVPMNTDLLDHGPDSLTLTNNGVSLVSSQADISVGYFDGSSYLSGAALSSFGNFHVSVWVKLISTGASQFIFAGVSSGDIFLGYQTDGGNKIGIGRNGIAWDNTTSYTLSTNTWYLLSFDRQGSTLTFSVNANAIGTHNNTRSYPTAGGFEIGNDGTGNTITGYMSNVIVESVGWTEQENQDYYDQTKANYGIS